MTEIERALDTSRKTLLILTPNYLASNWTTIESLMLQTDDPANWDLRLIPLYKAECELPRRINMVDHEADILIDLARLRAVTLSTGSGQAAMDEAQRLAEEALVITERSGYVLQGADTHLELAKLARVRGDKATACEHAQEARRLAACDGPPDYTYKAAYDEAGNLLAELESSREGSGGARSR